MSAPSRRLLPVLIGFLVVLAGCSMLGGGSTPTPGAADRSTPVATPTPGPATPAPRFAAEPPADWSGGTVALVELPREALETLGLVADGGPYPYRQDDGVFQNREGLLPQRPLGSYREYTVETPGSPDRGARRLVVEGDRWVYYTDDHYDSFRFVTP